MSIIFSNYYPYLAKKNCRSYFIVDPTEDEELVSEWQLVVAANSHQELTAICVTGRALIEKENILRACTIAIERTKTLTAHLKRALQSEREERNKNCSGFAHHIQNRKPVFFGPSSHVDLHVVEDVEEPEDVEEDMTVEDTKAFRFKIDEVGAGGPSAWGISDDENEECE